MCGGARDKYSSSVTLVGVGALVTPIPYMAVCVWLKITVKTLQSRRIDSIDGDCPRNATRVAELVFIILC